MILPSFYILKTKSLSLDSRKLDMIHHLHTAVCIQKRGLLGEVPVLDFTLDSFNGLAEVISTL